MTRSWRAAVPIVLTILSALGGWGCITWALVWATGAEWIWAASAGVLLLGLAGWKYIWDLLWIGLYSASQLPSGPAEAPEEEVDWR